MGGSDARRMRRRVERQRAHAQRPFPRTRPGEDLETFIAPAVTLDRPEAIESAFRQMHDDIIDRLGEQRRSGLRAHVIRGTRQCLEWLDTAYADRPDEAAQLGPYREFLTEHDGNAVLVVAECQVVR